MSGPAPDGQPNEHDSAAPDEPVPAPKDVREPGTGESTPEPDELMTEPDELTPEPDELTPEPDELTPEPDELTPEPEGPPGGGIFTLEGRRAPGLYVVAWILTVAGLAVTLVLGPMASDADAGVFLIAAGAVAVTLGLAAGAGSQILERADRYPERYRGPSPLLVFATYFFVMSLAGLVLITWLGLDPEQPFAFLGFGVVQATGYALIVWLFTVRAGVLSWPDMEWPALGVGVGDLVRVALSAAAVMVPITFGLLILGGIVGLLLGVDAPQVLPLSETPADGVMVTIAAAIVIPIGEELFFRGFALTAWRRDLGERSALIRSSLFFALVHVANIAGVDFVTGLSQALLQTVVLIPVAFVLGWLFLRYGMIGAISGHVTYNSLLLALAFLASKLPEPGTSDWPS